MTIVNISLCLNMHLPSTSPSMPPFKASVIQTINKLFCDNSVISISTLCYNSVRIWGTTKVIKPVCQDTKQSHPNRILKLLFCLRWLTFFLTLPVTRANSSPCTALQSLRSTFPCTAPLCDCLVVPLQFATKVPGLWKQDNQT